MLIIDSKDCENIDKALKKYKNDTVNLEFDMIG